MCASAGYGCGCLLPLRFRRLVVIRRGFRGRGPLVGKPANPGDHVGQRRPASDRDAGEEGGQRRGRSGDVVSDVAGQVEDRITGGGVDDGGDVQRGANGVEPGIEVTHRWQGIAAVMAGESAEA